jgi:RNA-directed DNA polymerase
MGLERSGDVVRTESIGQPGNGEEPARAVKPFGIAKRVVWEAYRHVKANRGAAGIDGESMEMFEVNLKDNLYRVWNRMSSGSYLPPAIRLVEIPKKSGGVRVLGIATVSANYPGSQRVFGMGGSSTSFPPAERPAFPGP